MADRQSFGDFVQSQPRQSFGDFVAASPSDSNTSGAIANFAKNFWGEMTATGQGMVDLFSHNPVDSIKAIGASQDAIRLKAQEAMKRGDYTEAARHAINYLILLVGSSLDKRGDQAQRGDVSGALGGTTAIGAQIFGPSALESAAPAVAEAASRAPAAIRTGVDATKAAVQAGGKDLAVGAGKTATGVALAKAGPLGEIADVIAGIPLVKSGMKQMGQGIRAGYSAGKAAAQLPVEPPTGGMAILSPDYFDRLRLPPGSAITPAPADTSFVRGVPAMYPTGPNPARALPPGRPVIVPEAPADPSFVRAVPGQYPDVIPPHLRSNAAAEANALTLRDLMRESGTLPPEAPAEAPAAEAPAAEPSNPFEAYARIAKAERLAKIANESGFTAQDAHDMITDEAARNNFARGTGEDSVSAQTMALIENQLKKLSRGRKAN